MEIIVELGDFLKQYCGNKKVVILKIQEDEITLEKVKEMVNIPKELGVVATSGNKVVDSKARWNGDKKEIRLIPPMNGG